MGIFRQTHLILLKKQENHNPLVGGSNPSTATICVRIDFPYIFVLFRISFLLGLSGFLALPAHRVWHLPVLNGSKRPSLPRLASYILNLPHAWISRNRPNWPVVQSPWSLHWTACPCHPSGGNRTRPRRDAALHGTLYPVMFPKPCFWKTEQR